MVGGVRGANLDPLEKKGRAGEVRRGFFDLGNAACLREVDINDFKLPNEKAGGTPRRIPDHSA